MAVSCFLRQPLVAATLGPATSSTSSKPPSTQSYCPQNNLYARASKKTQPTSSTSERDGGRGDSTRSRKGSVAEKSGPGYQSQNGGKGGSGGGGGPQVSKEKGGPVPTTMELEFNSNSVAAVPGPKPPAGFILDEEGAVVLVAPAANRVVTIVDTSSQKPLECMIRRAFQSSDGRDCLLLLPLDIRPPLLRANVMQLKFQQFDKIGLLFELMRPPVAAGFPFLSRPLQILKIDEEREGLTELSDEELQEILPSAVYALAKRRLHLIVSGFCLTARGGFCYTEEHVLDFKAEYGEGLGGSLTEGVEIANFQVGNSEYIIYTPFDPVMFVVHRDEATGQLKIADDELLDDEVVLDAIDEENEFQSLVDEEDAMHETLREAK